MGRLEDKVALITGAGSGIGLAIAKRYAAEGARVAGFDLQESDTWSEVEKLAPGALFQTGDVRDAAVQGAFVETALEQFGRIDVLVTAAGVAGGGPVHLLDEEEWDRVQDINLKGTFLSCKAVLPTMIEQRSGSIITIASVEGLEAQEGGSTYNASKAGVILLTKNMACDYGRLGIRANSICPGFIETPMFQTVTDGEAMADIKERIRVQHKLDRFGKPEEIAGAAFFLASDDSSFVSGQSLAVDGGFTAGKAFGITAMMGLE
jgi:NAD(P)-dependent dehydrogenase (short-subunit alcohol dehydrogenase family)